MTSIFRSHLRNTKISTGVGEEEAILFSISHVCTLQQREVEIQRASLLGEFLKCSKNLNPPLFLLHSLSAVQHENPSVWLQKWFTETKSQSCCVYWYAQQSRLSLGRFLWFQQAQCHPVLQHCHPRHELLSLNQPGTHFHRARQPFLCSKLVFHHHPWQTHPAWQRLALC